MGLMIGLKRGMVKLKPYNPQWKEFFKKEKKLISSVITAFLIDIQHIGSTAIPNIVAKPIIDVAVAIDSLDNIEKIIPPLENIGFIYRGEQGIPDRHMFVKGGENYRTHHLHVMQKDHYEWNKHILFRDYLKKHPNDAKQYSELKQKLFLKYGNDREKYTESKSEFIQNIIEKAKKKP
ncbi:MAG: GrpB family protein [Candidatus Heimdallarchaeota archaeon]|nr:MAG: GrpB family protein [Candidatus Heimdallarchaeota archaeon]